MPAARHRARVPLVDAAAGAGVAADHLVLRRFASRAVRDGSGVLRDLFAAAAAAGAPADGSTPGAGPPSAPVSLNSATVEQLDTLDGVGPATAQKIIAWRTQHGGFRSVADLGQVPGIGPKKLAALRDRVQP